MLKIAICENDVNHIYLLEKMILEWGDKVSKKVIIDRYMSAEAFLFQLEDINAYHLLIVEAKMNKISGIKLVERIRKHNKDMEVIFISDTIKYALYGYKVRAIDYLIKPIDKKELERPLEILKEKMNKIGELSTKIVIEYGKKNIKIDYNNIIYCIMFSPYIDICTVNDKFTIRKKISDMEKILPSNLFIRCHKSYLVNVKYIRQVTKKNIIMENKQVIPISRGKYDYVNEVFSDYFYGKDRGL